MNTPYNLVRVVTATTGTGTLTLGAAVSGWLTPVQAGAPDGAIISYSIHDINGGKEVGFGTLGGTGTTLTRTGVYRSTGAANVGKISLSGSAVVLFTVAAEDLTSIFASPTFTGNVVFPGDGIITSAGIVRIGYGTSSLTYGVNSGQGLQLVGGTGATASATGSRIAVGVFAANANATGLLTGKSRGSVTVPGALVSGDQLFFFNFYGDDGSVAGAFPVLSAIISAEVSGTVSTGVIPGRIMFDTMNAAGARATRWSISPEGLLAAGTTLSASFPAFKRNATAIEIRLSDDSGYAHLTALSLDVQYTGQFDGSDVKTGNGITIINVGGTPGIGQYGSGIVFTKIASGRRAGAIVPIQTTADGDQYGLSFWVHNTTTTSDAVIEGARLDHNAMFLLGPNVKDTAAFPALKRSATTIQVRLADDSAYGTFDALSILDSGAAPTGTAGSGYVRKISPQITTPDIVGTATNDNAAAGSAGEFASAGATAVSVVTATAKDIITLSLTAGDWDVEGFIKWNPAATTTSTIREVAVGALATNTLPTALDDATAWQRESGGITTGTGSILATGMCRISIAATTTIRLVGKATFATSTMTADGRIKARRRR